MIDLPSGKNVNLQVPFFLWASNSSSMALFHLSAFFLKILLDMWLVQLSLSSWPHICSVSWLCSCLLRDVLALLLLVRILLLYFRTLHHSPVVPPMTNSMIYLLQIPIQRKWYDVIRQRDRFVFRFVKFDIRFSRETMILAVCGSYNL